MDFENKIPEWKNEGTEPSEELRTKGFEARYKPPAAFFNWFWSLVIKCITEIQNKFKSHAENKSNPHGVTKSQVGLGNVDNVKQASKAEFDALTGHFGGHVADFENPHNVTAEQVGLGNVDNVKQASYTEFKTHQAEFVNFEAAFTAHNNNKSNPHGVTKEQVGLGNVPNVATNDQTPTYSDTTTLATLQSGEKVNIAFQKIKCAISNLISHIASHKLQTYVSYADIGLTIGSETIEGIVENLPDNSQLFVVVGADGADIYPSKYGVLYSYKKNDTRTHFEFFEKSTGKRYYGVYDSSITTKWQGWNLMYTAQHKPTPSDIGALPIDGSQSTTGANLYTNNKKGRVYTGANNLSIHHHKNGEESQDKDTRFIEMYSDTSAIEYAFKVGQYTNGALKRYNLHGEHNKPSGSYKGDGTFPRTVNIGGTGDTLLISSDNGMCLVTNRGAICKASNAQTVVGRGHSSVMFYDGVLTIKSDNDPTSEGYFNAEGLTYWYEVL